MRWPDDAGDWPLSEHSRQVLCRPHRWHIQEMGRGPTVLLLHGAGCATMTWRDIMPKLAERFHVIAIDLPGQGFTQLGARDRCGLDAMAEDIALLCKSECWNVSAIVGHSAGVAIALRLTQLVDGIERVVGINAALGNFKGLAGVLFPAIAKVLSFAPFTADVFTATSASPSGIRRLINSTGSTLDDTGLDLYQRLISDRGHVDATLAMMSQWSLDALLDTLPSIQQRCLLIAGSNDKAVPPETSERAALKLPFGEYKSVEGSGHLAHEEQPDLIASMTRAFILD